MFDGRLAERVGGRGGHLLLVWHQATASPTACRETCNVLLVQCEACADVPRLLLAPLPGGARPAEAMRRIWRKEAHQERLPEGGARPGGPARPDAWEEVLAAGGLHPGLTADITSADRGGQELALPERREQEAAAAID